MIINSSQGNIEAIGDVKEFKTSIDPKNLEFITTLLSSNLYSDPEQSFIREIVSNAWDSHVEAGTTDIPVIIKFAKSTNYDWSITIRDYGVGLSPERFKTIFCNIGSSTKRESNDYIGCFGIGRFASLACSNSVYITSYYNGTAYYYIMVKSENTIITNLVNELPTTEKNGVEISLLNIKNLDKYVSALRCIVFFPNIYIENLDKDISSINSIKIRHFTNFASVSRRIDLRLLLGNVLYPIQSSHFDYSTRYFITSLHNTGIAIKFNIGDLSVTPNRESIIYNNTTIDKIKNKLKEAKEELERLITSKLNKDYNDIIEYTNLFSKTLYYNPITDTIDTKSTSTEEYRVEDITELSGINVTFRGIDLKSSNRTVRIILNLKCINFKGILYNNTIYNKVVKYSLRKLNTFMAEKFIILTTDTKLTQVVKEYLKSKYNICTIIGNFELQDLYNYIDNNCSGIIKNNKEFDIIVNGIYDRVKNNAIYLDINTDTEFLEFKKQYKENNKNKKIDDKKESILYIYDIKNKKYYRGKQKFLTLSSMVSYIKNMKCGIILENMRMDEDVYMSIAKVRNFSIIKAKQDIVDYIRSLNLSCIVNFQYLLTKDKYISKIHTIQKYFKNGIHNTLETHKINLLYKVINTPLINDFVKMAEDYNKCDNIYLNLAKNDNIPIDSYTEHLCLKLQDYILRFNNILDIIDKSGFEENRALITAIAIKTKSFRANPLEYKRYKNNNLLKILCKK